MRTVIDRFNCPHCGKSIELTEALRHQIAGELLVTEREKIEKETARRAQDELTKANDEVQLLREESVAKEKKLQEFREQELILRKQKNLLEEKERAFEIEKQRQLDSERQKIAEKVGAEKDEQFKLRQKEWEEQKAAMQRAIEEAHRKGAQGSQQLQGEVQELDLETTLRSTFASDVLEPVAKGTLGADLRQIVKSPKGTLCGSILWESKRTKAWSDGWLVKLKEDLRADGANIPVIVSDALPAEAAGGFGIKEGVWITNLQLVVPVAAALRKSLLDATRERVISQNSQDKAAEIYAYVTSAAFSQQVEMMVATYREMQEQIARERVAYEKSWKQREAQVTRLLSGVAGIYGSLSGIAGSVLPPIKNLELSPGDDA